MDFAPRHVHARLARLDCGEERLAIPAVNRAVITGFSALVEYQVASDSRAATEAVVKIDGRAWPIENDVILYHGLACLRLIPEA